MSISTTVQAARGDEQADLLLTNCNIINVLNGQIEKGHLAVANGLIAGVGDYAASETLDMEGRYVAPGFIDSHVHIESSMASVTEFARTVVANGTTTVVADPHEIANVLGTTGIDYMLASAENQPMNVYYALPSCVPATDLETSGGKTQGRRPGAVLERRAYCSPCRNDEFSGCPVLRSPCYGETGSCQRP